MATDNKLKYRRLNCSKEIGNGIVDVKKKALTKNYELHWHDFFEVDYCYEGSGTNIVNGRHYEYSPGSVFLLTPTDLHEIKLKNPSVILTAMVAPATLSQKMTSEILGTGDVICCKLTGNKRVQFEALLDMLLSESKWNEKYNDLCLKSLVNLCFASILREYKNKKGNAADIHNVKNEKGFERAISYIMLNFTKNPSLTEISEALGYNPSYFSKRFGELYGMSYREYLLKTKLGYAKSLLISGDIDVSEVGYLSGFSSTQTFVADFRKGFGVTPTQFRKINCSQC